MSVIATSSSSASSSSSSSTLLTALAGCMIGKVDDRVLDCLGSTSAVLAKGLGASMADGDKWTRERYLKRIGGNHTTCTQEETIDF